MADHILFGVDEKIGIGWISFKWFMRLSMEV